MRRQVACDVTDESAVGAARRVTAVLAEEMGLSDTERGRIAISATELASNLVKHAGRGELIARAVDEDGAFGVELLSIDKGPGMADPERCLRDGFSSAGSPGTGLGAVRRLSSEFDLHSASGTGTIVLSRVLAPARSVAGGLQLGAISIPIAGESVCGDAWSFASRDEGASLLVADGLGHGPIAKEAADTAVGVFEQNAFAPPERLLESMNGALRSTRGAAVAVAHVPTRGKVRYAGIGNISGTLSQRDGKRRGLMSNNGIVGGEPRSARELEYERMEDDLLIMHSDGLKSHWSLSSYLGLAMRHPAVIAAALYRDFRRGNDDTTVLVLRERR